MLFNFLRKLFFLSTGFVFINEISSFLSYFIEKIRNEILFFYKSTPKHAKTWNTVFHTWWDGSCTVTEYVPTPERPTQCFVYFILHKSICLYFVYAKSVYFCVNNQDTPTRPATHTTIIYYGLYATEFFLGPKQIPWFIEEVLIMGHKSDISPPPLRHIKYGGGG